MRAVCRLGKVSCGPGVTGSVWLMKSLKLKLKLLMSIGEMTRV